MMDPLSPRESLLRQAEAAEEAAHVVSFQPDKVRLLEQARRLREEARLMLERSWSPK